MRKKKNVVLVTLLDVCNEISWVAMTLEDALQKDEIRLEKERRADYIMNWQGEGSFITSIKLLTGLSSFLCFGACAWDGKEDSWKVQSKFLEKCKVKLLKSAKCRGINR